MLELQIYKGNLNDISLHLHFRWCCDSLLPEIMQNLNEYESEKNCCTVTASLPPTEAHSSFRWEEAEQTMESLS